MGKPESIVDKNKNTVKKWPVAKFKYFLSALIFGCVLILGIFHSINGGINLTDEGLYISAPYHYRFGVVPFKDAIHNATRNYDLLMAPIFILFPNITVLQYRIIGVVLHLSSIAAVFFLFSRFAPPILVAATGAIFFLNNNFAGIPTPSYNSLTTTFGNWAFVLWMSSLFYAKSKRIMLSVLSGVFLSFMIVSNISSGILLIVPLISSAFFYLKRLRREAILTVLTVGVGVLMLEFGGILLLVNDIWHYFVGALLNDALSSYLNQVVMVSKTERIWEKISSFSQDSLYLIYVINIVGIALLLLNKRAKKKIFNFILLFFSAFTLFFLLLPVINYPSLDLVLVIFSILSIPIILISFHAFRGNERYILILAVIWSLIQIVSFSTFSTNAFLSSVKGSFLVFLVALLSTYKLYLNISIPAEIGKYRKLFAFFAISIVIGLFTFRGITTYLDTNYLEVNYKKLTSVFTHPKLAGINSTPEKVSSLEELLMYLESRLKKGDYLLAYTDIPILYYLTDTRPLYPNVWSFEFWWPLSYRKKLLEKMVKGKNKAEYAIHMVTNPGYGWGTPIAEGMSFDLKVPGDCLLCDYVEKNYVLEKFIFPFEIWRLGKGERFEFLKKYYSYYDEGFVNFSGKERKLEHGELAPIKPLWLEAVHGRYTMQTRKEGKKTIIKFIFDGVSSIYPSTLDISYFSERDGFSFIPTSGEELALTATVRLSERRAIHPYYSAVLFIQDKLINIDEKTYITPDENSRGYPPLLEKDSLYWQTNSVAIYKPNWNQYAVVRKIRNGANHVNFGLTWAPMYPGDWIEIRDIHFYTNKKAKADKFKSQDELTN